MPVPRTWRSAAIPKKGTKEHRAIRVQYGALPYRLNEDASIEVLLITSRRTQRWIIPKGWPIKDLKPAKAAAREAYEEAGVRGRIAGRPMGRYTYEKQLDNLDVCVPCEVQVFPLAVKGQSKEWPEFKERTARWFSAVRAAKLVEDSGLRKLILLLKAQKSPVLRR